MNYILSNIRSESDSNLDNFPKDCQVCGKRSHGIHFGATVCRACAAFFRRSAAGTNFVLKCKTGMGKCIIIASGRLCCKKCRLNKCKEIGMEMSNFQFDRDPHKNSEKVVPSLSVYLGRPEFLIFCDPSSASTSTFIDVSDIIKMSTGILTRRKQDFLMTKKNKRNRLHKLASALDINKFNNTPEVDFKIFKFFGLKESMSSFERDILLVSKWLTYFDEFQELCIDIRMTFIKTIWHLWSRLEKLGRTAMFKKWNRDSMWADVLVLLEDDRVLDTQKLNRADLDISWLTSYSAEHVGYYIEGIGNLSMFKPLQLILDLNPTEVEFNYMLAQLSFSYAAKLLGEPYSDHAEHFLQLLADDLHDYYIIEERMPIYSDRISKMMKVNNSVMRVFYEKKEKLEIARVFNIFHAKYSEPDMFKDIS